MPIIRAEIAKMIVNYAVKVLKKSPDSSLACKFTDIASLTPELQGYAKLACQLGLMKGIDGQFLPEAQVTRAQFATILSRLLYGDKYEGGDLYYSLHLQALRDNGILTNILDSEHLLELRGYIMLMLMRSNLGE
jgi:hypothetical protein